MYQYTLHRPKKDGTGLAVSFDVNGDVCLLKLARQQPSQGENASFAWVRKGEKADPKKNAQIKLGLADLGAFLAVFNGSLPEAKIYHEFQPKEGNKITTALTLSEYVKEGKFVAYALNIMRGTEKWGSLIGFAEAEVLKLILKEAVLSQCFVDLGAK